MCAFLSRVLPDSEPPRCRSPATNLTNETGTRGQEAEFFRRKINSPDRFTPPTQWLNWGRSCSDAASDASIWSPPVVPDPLFAGLSRLGDSRDSELEALLQPLAPALELDAVDLLGLQLLDQVVKLLLLLFPGLLLRFVLWFWEVPAHDQRQRDPAVDYRHEPGRRERIPGYAVLERDLLGRVRLLLVLLLRRREGGASDECTRQRDAEGPLPIQQEHRQPRV